jgi:MinD-like ATPase involved in chromosome partitioning or flagellar assembly
VAKIISVHSYRGGTGKSNVTANLAVCLAAAGKRVAVVDTDIQSPGIHMLFGLKDTNELHTLNDYLSERCRVREAAVDVTPDRIKESGGQIWLVPSSLHAGEIAKVLREGYNVGLMNDGLQDLIDELLLDYLLIDTHPGLNEETLLSIAISDVLVVLLRPDRQDFQGTAVTVEVARKLEVRQLVMVLNKVLPSVTARGFVDEVTRAYGAPICGVLPEAPEMLELGSSGLFTLQFPDHPLSAEIRVVASRLA